MGKALQLMGLALQSDDGSEVFVARFRQHLDGHMDIDRARFGAPQIDCLEHPAHAATPDQCDETESALQDIPDTDSHALGLQPAGAAGDDGGISGPVGNWPRYSLVW